MAALDPLNDIISSRYGLYKASAGVDPRLIGTLGGALIGGAGGAALDSENRWRGGLAGAGLGGLAGYGGGAAYRALGHSAPGAAATAEKAVAQAAHTPAAATAEKAVAQTAHAPVAPPAHEPKVVVSPEAHYGVPPTAPTPTAPAPAASAPVAPPRSGAVTQTMPAVDPRKGPNLPHQGLPSVMVDPAVNVPGSGATRFMESPLEAAQAAGKRYSVPTGPMPQVQAPARVPTGAHPAMPAGAPAPAGKPAGPPPLTAQPAAPTPGNPTPPMGSGIPDPNATRSRALEGVYPKPDGTLGSLAELGPLKPGYKWQQYPDGRMVALKDFEHGILAADARKAEAARKAHAASAAEAATKAPVKAPEQVVHQDGRISFGPAETPPSVKQPTPPQGSPTHAPQAPAPLTLESRVPTLHAPELQAPALQAPAPQAPPPRTPTLQAPAPQAPPPRTPAGEVYGSGGVNAKPDRYGPTQQAPAQDAHAREVSRSMREAPAPQPASRVIDDRYGVGGSGDPFTGVPSTQVPQSQIATQPGLSAAPQMGGMPAEAATAPGVVPESLRSAPKDQWAWGDPVPSIPETRPHQVQSPWGPPTVEAPAFQGQYGLPQVGMPGTQAMPTFTPGLPPTQEIPAFGPNSPGGFYRRDPGLQRPIGRQNDTMRDMMPPLPQQNDLFPGLPTQADQVLEATPLPQIIMPGPQHRAQIPMPSERAMNGGVGPFGWGGLERTSVGPLAPQVDQRLAQRYGVTQ